MTGRQRAATAGLLALGVGALAVGKRKADSRGPPECKDPECGADAVAEHDWTTCGEHGYVEVPVRD
jgi:hypothetical protein